MKKITHLISTVSVAVLFVGGLQITAANAASKTVVIETDFTGASLNTMQADFDHWSVTSHIKVKLNGDTNFATDIVTQVKTHQTPNLAIWAQPGGLLAQSAAEVPLESLVNVKKITSQLIPGLSTLAKKNGKTYGLPISLNLKTLLWYNTKAFKASGYAVPTTYAQLVALSNKIEADGSGYPFCVGGGSGWPLTDWFEQYVADLDGTTTYNNWIAGTTKFGSPSIAKAAMALGELLLKDGASNGNGTGIANDPYNNTAPLFTTGGKAAGQCFMYKQGSFASGFFPANIQSEISSGDTTDINVTGFPVVTGGKSVTEGGGNTVAAFTKDKSTAAVLTYLLSPNFGHIFASDSFFLSPFKNFDTTYYPNVFRKKFATVLEASKAFVFDASDQMPPAVNTAFGNEMTSWFGGQESYAQAAVKIDAAYNK